MPTELIYKRWGYEIHKILPAQPSPFEPEPYRFPPGHGFVRPTASYSPWLLDLEFQRVYQLIRPNTLVDEYRCYELWKLAQRVQQGVILEVGVWKGGTGCLLAAASNVPVILCDTFAGVVKAGPRDNPKWYKGGEHADATIAEVSNLAAAMGVAERVKIVQGIFPDDCNFSLGPIGLCHIDVDVYESARGVFEAVWPCIRVGGTVVFDDYGFEACVGVTDYVNELRLCNGVIIHNLNGHAIVINTNAIPSTYVAESEKLE